MQFRRIYLDSNILITAFGGDSDHDLALHIMGLIVGEIPRPSPSFLTSELTLAEVLVRPMRANDLLSQQRFGSAVTTSSWLHVEPVTRNILWGSAQLRGHHQGLKTPDAIHLSTAIATQCFHFLTADKGIGEHYHIDVAQNGEPPARMEIPVIRPDVETLISLSEWLHS